MDDLTQAQRRMWGAGDYPRLSALIADVGERVVARAGVAPGMDVLDVACGTGNAAIPAARAGAGVTGIDLTPELLAHGREAAAREGLDVAWVEGDAEDLPFADRSFDRVLSTFGHMFAPRHRRAADEMARVCRPGGAVAICCWTPEGSVGRLFAATAPFQPPPPDFASPPLLWGTEVHVREMFPGASGFEFERHATTIDWESVEGWADVFTESFGPVVTARRALGPERFGEMRAAMVAVWEEANRATDGRMRLPQEYLLSVVRL